jgi:hypothetical protein
VRRQRWWSHLHLPHGIACGNISYGVLGPIRIYQRRMSGSWWLPLLLQYGIASSGNISLDVLQLIRI